MKHLFTEWRVTVFGLLSWAIPFVAAIPFFSPSGELLVPQPLFKSLMVVIGGGVGVLLLVGVFRRVSPSIAAGLAVGVYWLALNWLLDVLVLVPMSGESLPEYFFDIGLRYLLLPIIATGMGAVARRSP